MMLIMYVNNAVIETTNMYNVLIEATNAHRIQINLKTILYVRIKLNIENEGFCFKIPHWFLTEFLS